MSKFSDINKNGGPGGGRGFLEVLRLIYCTFLDEQRPNPKKNMVYGTLCQS
jgi:hypothetical protein